LSKGSKSWDTELLVEDEEIGAESSDTNMGLRKEGSRDDWGRGKGDLHTKCDRCVPNWSNKN
jgi:hypothetical protein